MAPHPAPTAALLSIGTEIVLGEIVDTNAAFLAGELRHAGLELRTVRQVGDDADAIAAAFSECLAAFDVVIATGGLGPTHDDLTREALAQALGEELFEDAALVVTLRSRFRGMGEMPVANLRQAMRIRSAHALANPIGSAPGWWTDRDGNIGVLLPGVPGEMRRMWGEQVLPRLERRLTLRPLHARVVKAFGIGESAAAATLDALLRAPGIGIEAGIYARDDGIHVRFASRDLGAPLDDLVERALAALGEDAYATDQATLVDAALGALARRGVTTIATVESGTHGALLSALSELGQGAEPRFVGGVCGERADAAALDADATLFLAADVNDDRGRARCTVRLGGMAAFGERRSMVQGVGAQLYRRAAFSALDQVRRALTVRPKQPSDR